MTKEQIYEIQNKLINDVASDVWTTAKDKAEDNMKSLAYINGVLEMTDEIIELLDTVKNSAVEEQRN